MTEKPDPVFVQVTVYQYRPFSAGFVMDVLGFLIGAGLLTWALFNPSPDDLLRRCVLVWFLIGFSLVRLILRWRMGEPEVRNGRK